MKIKLLSFNPVLHLWLVFLFSISIINSQNFERVENVIGLGILEENNGVAVADIDGDNDLDVFVVAKSKDIEGVEKTHSRLFRNDNDGSFTDITAGSGLEYLLLDDTDPLNNPALNGDKYGAYWGDYNNDGYPDLLVTQKYGIKIFKNLGNYSFGEITQNINLENTSSCQFAGAVWVDYNRDGLLDFYLSDWKRCEGNLLFRNDGNDSFTNVTAITGADEGPTFHSFNPTPIDINEDGYVDLFVPNDVNDPNQLYINNSGVNFTNRASEYGLDNQIDDMCIVTSDYDRDGDLDFFITGIDENKLFQNNGNSYSSQEITMGVNNSGWAWGAVFSDLDLDGDEDLFVVNGYDFQEFGEQENIYYVNQLAQNQSGFIADSDSELREVTISVDIADFDYDNDGDIDLLVTNNDRPSYFYENKTINFDATHTYNWFKLKLQGVASNRDAIGAIVTLTTASNIVYKKNYSGVSMFAQSQKPIYFGLGNDSEISEIRIKWPSGLSQVVTSLNSNTTVLVVEGSEPQLLNIEPSQKIYGCTDPNSCTYNPEASLDDGTCQYLESFDISGNTSPGFLSTESYTYPLTEGSTGIWEVGGAELLSGQGTNQITVKWAVEEEGFVYFTEANGICQSEQVQLNIHPNVNNLASDVSIARIWNEALLEAIRGDFARPTVHARNLFHVSVAMYDAWAIYDEVARPYFIGNEVHSYTSELVDFIPVESIEESQKKAISFAAYRLLSHRFADSPSAEKSQARFDLIMDQLGYNYTFQTGLHYEFGNAAALGNYIADHLINYGSTDGSREQSAYDNSYYSPINPPLNPTTAGNPTIVDPNRWQPLSLETFIDQSGNLIEGATPDFLSPEWGDVLSFALTDEDKSIYTRDGNSYSVYNNPTDPPYLDNTNSSEASQAYKWGFSLVSVWASHLDPSDGVIWDISPNTIGNISFESFPTHYSQYASFYNLLQGGDISAGHALNPSTGIPYESQMVPRGDYARILAEFWADGPDSETPPGHWFTLLNYVNDRPQFEKRFKGEGEVLDPLEWDLKAYFILGGTMHDAAISAWSIKGWYDYIRPISAIRYMADKGQCSNENLSNYHPEGIPLLEGLIEVVEENDPLAGIINQNVGKIKLFTWRGHDFINDPDEDQAGVGWILSDNWWPYQRPSFVTPPFAGFVSGHSTYSRAAAEVLTRLTGDAYFPGGIGEFEAKQNDFLVFEKGPSMDVTLQWATYRDASDQCSLSRIWGGIHPPADDIPGRIIGEKVGNDAFNFAEPYFYSDEIIPEVSDISVIFPNPVENGEINITNTNVNDEYQLFDMTGKYIEILSQSFNEDTNRMLLSFPEETATGLYILKINKTRSKLVIIK